MNDLFMPYVTRCHKARPEGLCLVNQQVQVSEISRMFFSSSACCGAQTQQSKQSETSIDAVYVAVTPQHSEDFRDFLFRDVE